jgi:hypothetical protein
MLKHGGALYGIFKRFKDYSKIYNAKENYKITQMIA